MSNQPKHYDMSYDDFCWIREQMSAVLGWLGKIDQTVGIDLDNQKRSILLDEASKAAEGLQGVLDFLKKKHGFEYWEQRGFR
jgi:hypothetical protein